MAATQVAGTPVPDSLLEPLICPINLSSLRESVADELKLILDDMGGKSAVVIDSPLLAPLNLCIPDFSRFLKEQGMEAVESLQGPGLVSIYDFVLFIVQTKRPSVTCLIENIRKVINLSPGCVIHVAFTPRTSFLCDQQLKEAKVWDDIQVHGLGLDLIPLDSDIISLNIDDSYRECSVDGNHSSLNAVASSLIKLQNTYGIIPSVCGIGKYAVETADIMLRMLKEEVNEKYEPGSHVIDGDLGGPNFTVRVGEDLVSNTTGSGANYLANGDTICDIPHEIDSLVIIDRGVDLVSPLVTPLTVEGLIYEHYQCLLSTIGVDSSILEGSSDASAQGKAAPIPMSPDGKSVIYLNSNDALYTNIRDLVVSSAATVLKERAEHLQNVRSSISHARDLDFADIHNFVKSIPTLQHDMRALRVWVEIANVLQSLSNSSSFDERWQLEHALLDGDSTEETTKATHSKLVSLLANSIVSRLVTGEDDSSEDPLKLKGSQKKSAGIDIPRTLTDLLRILCLHSTVDDGIKKAEMESLKKDLQALLGFAAIPLFSSLEESGLLRARDSSGLFRGKSRFSQLRVPLNLTAKDDDDIGYVTAGYAPMSVRFVEKLLNGNISFESVLGEAKNPIVKVRVENAASDRLGNTEIRDRKVILLCYVGGICPIEISAIRRLSLTLPYDFLVLTTGIMTGAEFIQSVTKAFIPGIDGDYNAFAVIKGNEYTFLEEGEIAMENAKEYKKRFLDTVVRRK